ncbi:MAG: 50S ribosomal protein L11 methyltransferase [Verrucomicrobia bacterium]|nr:50S ribosomal protein L11 methyltransferase [Verrucomicrobiota bacterium]
MNPGMLCKVSVAIAPRAEEPVVELCQRLWGQSPAIWTDAQHRSTTASVYLKPGSEWGHRQRAALLAGLAALRRAGVDAGSGPLRVERLHRRNWADSWKRHFRPLVFGKTLLIKPSWSRRQSARDQAVVVLDPGLSFGTGQHPTTRFCLAQLVRIRRRQPALSFLDVGTGSGILAIAAATLGCEPVSALDVDAGALRVARANAAQNKVRHLIRWRRADVGALPARARRRYDVVCANLTCELLLAHRARLLSRVGRGGRLVLAGILARQFGAVQRAYEASGCRLVVARTCGPWRSGTFVCG